MKSYLSYFKLKFITGLQYRAAAIAGISTQFFFGFVFTSVYIAFYESGGNNLPMSLPQLITYTWLGQAFFSLIYLWYKDKQILNLIKSGNIAYELCRPQDLYFMWASKILGERLSAFTLRFLPVIIVTILIPSPYKLVLCTDIKIIILFIISIINSSILMTCIVLLFHIICLFTLDEKGVVNIFMVIADILSGMIIPVAFFPKFLSTISNYLPFRYVTDFPFRLYVGNISTSLSIKFIFIQLIWIIILVVIGRLLVRKALSKVTLQGG